MPSSLQDRIEVMLALGATEMYLDDVEYRQAQDWFTGNMRYCDIEVVKWPHIELTIADMRLLRADDA